MGIGLLLGLTAAVFLIPEVRVYLLVAIVVLTFNWFLWGMIISHAARRRQGKP